VTAATPPASSGTDADAGSDATAAALELAIGRVLVLGALVGVGFLLAGVALMVAGGISPTSGTATGFDAGRLGQDLLGGRPEGFLWAGIAILIATPVVRVVGELVAFAWRRDRTMAAVAAAILGIISLGVVLGSIPEA
jgi:uncharacterized membrane protein